MLDAINRAASTYLAPDGRTYPVTDWYDEDGDPCQPDDAVAAVAGSSENWWAIILSGFEPAAVQ